jgi:uncharacterized membrane protein YuzA (DUF378 family)
MSTSTARADSHTTYDYVNIAIWALVALAAVNWGLVGLMDYNLVEKAVLNWLSLDQGALDLAYIAIGAMGAYDLVETFYKQ